QPARRDLVEQRLEQVKVAPVDQRHLQRRPTEAPRGAEPAEAAADDHDAVYAGHVSALRPAWLIFSNGIGVPVLSISALGDWRQVRARIDEPRDCPGQPSVERPSRDENPDRPPDAYEDCEETETERGGSPATHSSSRINEDDEAGEGRQAPDP